MAFILGVGLLAHCERWFKPATPKLAVVIVVDQMRYDYLVRFAGLFSGGFAKLLNEGAVFTNAHHDHAGTETAPGHATLLTGAFPSQHGIIGNAWNNRHTGARVYCVDDSGFALIKSGEQEANALSREGKSPKNLLRHTLGDWLKAKYPQAKVISIAGKDRSAILMAGFDADAAYWFHSATGGFVSSRYYLDALPAWLAKWNAERHADRYDAKLEKSHRRRIISCRAKICSTLKTTASTPRFRINLRWTPRRRIRWRRMPRDNTPSLRNFMNGSGTRLFSML
jgi:hypothetical protein